MKKKTNHPTDRSPLIIASGKRAPEEPGERVQKFAVGMQIRLMSERPPNFSADTIFTVRETSGMGTRAYLFDIDDNPEGGCESPSGNSGWVVHTTEAVLVNSPEDVPVAN